jgi:hypothetical protein
MQKFKRTKTQMAQPVESVKNRFQLSDCAIKKAIPK